jgi:hypothetical protein
MEWSGLQALHRSAVWLQRGIAVRNVPDEGTASRHERSNRTDQGMTSRFPASTVPHFRCISRRPRRNETSIAKPFGLKIKFLSSRIASSF